MNQKEPLFGKVSVHIGDIPKSAVEYARHTGLVAWDIETSGLDWKDDRIGTCQIYVPNYQVYIVQINPHTPPYHLKTLLKDENICKVFHHAMFDLRFMVYQWSVNIQNIACTKIASKILRPSVEDHSLKSLLRRYCGINLDKSLQRSNWLITHLTPEQINYAVGDVIYLPQLLENLQRELMIYGRLSLAEASFAYLPVRVQLDILGCNDVFLY